MYFIDFSYRKHIKQRSQQCINKVILSETLILSQSNNNAQIHLEVVLFLYNFFCKFDDPQVKCQVKSQRKKVYHRFPHRFSPRFLHTFPRRTLNKVILINSTIEHKFAKFFCWSRWNADNQQYADNSQRRKQCNTDSQTYWT